MGTIWMLGASSGVDLDSINVSAADIMSGKKAVDSNGNIITGTIVDQGTKTATLNCGESYTIPAGKHNGSGKVTANSLSSQTSADAVAGNILKNKTAWVNGSKVTGSMPNYAGTPQHIDARRLANSRFEVAVAAGYHGYSWAGNSYEYMELSEVASTLGLTAAKLAKGQTVCGIAGTYTSDANAAASHILKDKTAYVNGSKITGNIASLGAQTITPGTSDKTISSGQYLSGVQTIKGDSNLVAANIIKGKSIFGVNGTASIYKYLSVNVTSSSTTQVFHDTGGSNWSRAYVTYGAIDFTPTMFICRHKNKAGEGTFLISPGANMLGLFEGTWNSGKTIDIVPKNGDCYWGKSGFKFPVPSVSTAYQFMIFGYY